MTIASTVQKFYRGHNRNAGLDIPSISPVDTLAEDVFTDTDGTDLTSHSMNVGAGWSALAGSMTVQSNAAVCQSPTTAYATQCNRPDAIIYCDIKCGAANANFGPSILLRAHDNSNYVQAYFAGDGTFSMYQKIGGSLTLIKAGRGWTADTNWHTVKIICQSTYIVVYLDGILMWEGNVPTLAGSTKFGMLGFVFGGLKDSFDNFRVITDRRVDTFPGRFIANSFTDAFTQANGTQLGTLGWTENTGDWEVSSNQATQVLNAAPTNGYVVSRDIGISDNFGLEVTVTTPATGGFICGIVFRMLDRNNFVEVEINSGVLGGFGVWYTDNTGVFTEVSRQNTQVFDPSNATTYTLRVRVEGPIIIAELVEASLKLVTYLEKFQYATKVGLFEFRHATNYPNANLYDNFRVYQ